MQTFLLAKLFIIALLSLLWALPVNAQLQSKAQQARQYLQNEMPALDIDAADLTEMKISSETYSRLSGITHIYFQQHINEIPVYGAILNSHITRDNQLLTFGNRFVSEARSKVNQAVPAITQEDAVQAAIKHFGYDFSGQLLRKEFKGGTLQEIVFEGKGLSLADIPVKLTWQPMEDGSLRLAWDLSIYELDAQNWWSIRIDAATGEFLHKDNWVVHCNFDHSDGHACNHGSDFSHEHTTQSFESLEGISAPVSLPVNESSVYNVFPPPFESPNHGGRQLISNPADPIASPYGWHDTDGILGAEYTITRGNNAHAGLDRVSPNGIDPGSEPDGGASLQFDFPLDLNLDPLDPDYQKAAVTNLFFWNNYVHDFAYHYGFDEISGNFQQNNYDRGGVGGDYVFAEAQDYSGTNNANFATPPDGQNPRMQMYIWNSGITILQVHSPAGVAGEYGAGDANFGPQNFTVAGDLVVAIPNGACTGITNDISGKIVLIDRGSCTFVTKVANAQLAGAIGVIIVNIENSTISMGGSDPGIIIPSIMVSLSDGNAIKAAIAEGTVSATISSIPITNDSDFDNGVIVHEYAHGISNRLTGGPAIVNCLGNQEQMGEGWSDYFSLITTMLPGAQGTDTKGIGTYLLGQSVDGNGIRPTPYSTEMTINPSTYNTIKTVSVPHGVGYVWATMLWDMTWELIDANGFEAGFDQSVNLVMEGMKLQPCQPGFVDGRDAILAADIAIYGGENQCLIWTAFARRGLGFSASQGSSNSRSDGTEAFDLPSECQPTGLEIYPVINDTKAIQHSFRPNPFADQAVLHYTLPQSGKVSVRILNHFGQTIKLITEEFQQAGSHQKSILETDLKQSGTYHYQISLESATKTYQVNGKILLIR